MTSARTIARKATQRDARRITRGAVPAALRDATRRDARRITRGAVPAALRDVKVRRSWCFPAVRQRSCCLRMCSIYPKVYAIFVRG